MRRQRERHSDKRNEQRSVADGAEHTVDFLNVPGQLESSATDERHHEHPVVRPVDDDVTEGPQRLLSGDAHIDVVDRQVDIADRKHDVSPRIDDLARHVEPSLKQRVTKGVAESAPERNDRLCLAYLIGKYGDSGVEELVDFAAQ